MDRYARQTMIAGWDQLRLVETTLLVAGCGWLARMVSLLATAMGFGRVVLMGDRQVVAQDCRFLLANAQVGTSVVRSWAEALEAINRDVEVMYVHDGPYQRAFDQVPKPDVVVEASADMVGKCGGVCANVIQAVAGSLVGMYCVGDGLCDVSAFEKEQEDPLVAMSLAALVVEEARRLRMCVDAWDVPASGTVRVSLEGLHREAGGGPMVDFGKKQVHLVGAGALGTWTGIGLGLSATEPIDMVIYDPDGVSTSNLNRQVLYGDALYKPKAPVLAEKLSALFPKVNASGRLQAVKKANLAEVCNADVVISGPDNLGTRALLNRGAVTYTTPLVNGGTSIFGADVTAYVPGKSACLECALRVETAAEQVGEVDGRVRCGLAPEASVVTSSALAGALMAFEARAALASNPARGVLVYDGQTSGCRLGVRSVQLPCMCS